MKRKKHKQRTPAACIRKELDRNTPEDRRIRLMNSVSQAFISELQALPLWQQQLIIDHIFDLFEQGFRCLRVIIAGVNTSRAAFEDQQRQREASREAFMQAAFEMWQHNIDRERQYARGEL